MRSAPTTGWLLQHIKLKNAKIVCRIFLRNKRASTRAIAGTWACSVLSRHKQGQIRVESPREKPATLRTSARVWTSERH